MLDSSTRLGHRIGLALNVAGHAVDEIIRVVVEYSSLKTILDLARCLEVHLPSAEEGHLANKIK
jgi:hypothetical protein